MVINSNNNGIHGNEKKREGTWTMVDLKGKCNHRVYCCKKNDIEKEQLGNCWLEDGKEAFIGHEKAGTRIVEDVPFQLPPFGNGLYDNMECDEQEIFISAKKYTMIHVLGFANYEPQTLGIEIIMSPIERKFIEVSLLMWQEAGRAFSGEMFSCDKLLNCSPTLHSKSIRGNDVGLTKAWADISNVTGCIHKIVFPFNPLCHIIAITLKA